MSDAQVSMDEKTRRILFFDDVKEESCHLAVKHIFTLTEKDPKEPIDFIINTFGGYLAPCFGLLDVMAHVRPKIRTVGLGMVASCGLLLLMAGEKGHRRVSSSAAILSHQFSSWSSGNYGELMSSRDRTDWTHERMIQHYLKHTKKSRKYIEKLLQKDTDTWLRPSQAVKHGLVDKVIRGNI